jgi:hypothetical protein
MRLNKTAKRLALDGLLRDSLRSRDAIMIMETVWDIVQVGVKGLESPDGGFGDRNEELLGMSMGVVAGWVCEFS